MTEKENKEYSEVLKRTWSEIFRLNKMIINHIQEFEEAKEEYTYHQSNYNQAEANKYIEKIRLLQPKIAILAMKMRIMDTKIIHLNPNFRYN